MQELIKEISINQSLRGGLRKGAGRPVGSVHRDKWYKARGINPVTAMELLATIYNEKRAWKRIFESADDRVVLQGLMFLTSMRDGKPSQQINVSQTTLTLNSSDLERARDIIREIRGEHSSLSQGQGMTSESGRDKSGLVIDGEQSGGTGSATGEQATQPFEVDVDHSQQPQVIENKGIMLSAGKERDGQSTL